METAQPTTNPEPTSGPGPERQAREADLIRRICAGEKELYYELIQPYERSVYLTALAITRNEADAEDVAQEALLKALRALSTFRGESRFSTWLERIAVNEGRLRLRRIRTEKVESLEIRGEDAEDDYMPLDIGDWREIPSEALERSEVRDLLVRALQQIPDKYREVIVLRDIRGKNIVETAELLGITQASVKTRLRRARLQLRDRIAPFQRTSSVLSRNPFKRGRKLW